jgi:hypothetical protein
MLPLLAGGMFAAGLIGSATQKRPKYNMGALNQTGALIEKQYGDVESYFKEAGTAFEGQYSRYYGQQMQDAVSQMASRGIYESPVSERALGRKREALGESYAAGKSQLAGQKMQAIGQIDQSKINYLQNLAGAQYSRQMAKQQQQGQMYSMLGGLGGSLLGL